MRKHKTTNAELFSYEKFELQDKRMRTKMCASCRDFTERMDTRETDNCGLPRGTYLKGLARQTSDSEPPLEVYGFVGQITCTHCVFV